MGFPKGASIPFAIISIGGGVKSPPAKWLRLIGEFMAKRAFKYVGHSVARVDGLEKVTGQAKFVGDIAVPGMLYGKILRSTFPHARIRSIDALQAEALPGVVAVLTAADIGDLNPIYNGRPVIAMDKVRYIGEPVAAVAAEDLATAEEALGLIHVDYEELPATVGIEAAIKPGAPLVHDDKAGNIGTHEKVARGNVDEGFAQSDVIAEDHFTFPMVYHYAMEPHSAVAHYGENEITVWSSAQHPFQVRGDIAKVFKVPTAQVRIIIITWAAVTAASPTPSSSRWSSRWRAKRSGRCAFATRSASRW